MWWSLGPRTFRVLRHLKKKKGHASGARQVAARACVAQGSVRNGSQRVAEAWWYLVSTYVSPGQLSKGSECPKGRGQGVAARHKGGLPRGSGVVLGL
mgnify:CR=1 FL=1